MSQRQRIYLDNAATSWPKPPSVYDAVDDYQRRLGATVGRSGYGEAAEVERAVDQARADVAKLIGAESPERIVFTFNGTDALNLAIHGTLRHGDHVIATVAEHNSVLRPLRRLEKRNRNSVTRVECNSAGVVDPEDIRAALRPETRLIVLTHASNVTGAIQPIIEVGRIARQHGALFLVDAAQTLGHIPLSVTELGADLLAAPGHKGLLGPSGTGVLYIRPNIEHFVDAIRQGGTGSSSSTDEQPISLPQKYESGSHNVPGIVGLGAGVQYLESRGLENIRRHDFRLTELLLQGLSEVAGVRVFGPRSAARQVGVVSFSITGLDAPAVAQTLDDRYHIQARAGFQCAALMHRSLGTLQYKGTVRFSLGHFNTEEDVEAAVRAVASLVNSRPVSVTRIPCPCVDHVAAPAVESSTRTYVDSGTPSSPSTDVRAIPGLQDLWNHTLGDPAVCVAVIDGPIAIDHPCFSGASITTVSDGLPSTCLSADRGSCVHGTHVASILFAQHRTTEDLYGVAPKCRGLIIPVFRDDPRNPGRVLPSSQSQLARALDIARERGARIINISAGQASPDGVAEPRLAAAVKRCLDDQILIVSAAGNDGCRCLHVPAALPGVLVVGASDRSGQPADFSNFGELYESKGILAPGEGIHVAMPGGGVASRSGTSFATPLIAGIAALLLSMQTQSHATADARSGPGIRDLLLRSARPCALSDADACRRFLTGVLDLPRVLQHYFTGENPMKTEGRYDTHTLVEQPIPSADAGTTMERLVPGVTDDAREYLSEAVVAASAPEREAGSVLREDVAAQNDSASAPRSSRRLPATAKLTVSENQSGCGCGGGPAQLVYALGSLSYDFGTQARYDGISIEAGKSNPPLPPQIGTSDLVDHFRREPYAATSVIWTLNDEATPVYAVRPDGPFAAETYGRLVQFLSDQIDPAQLAERISLPGYIAGSETLMYGQSIPVVVPELRGMRNWTTMALVESVCGASTEGGEEDQERKARGVRNFLDRIYYEIRNLGQDPRDRALNFAATNAFNVERIFERAASGGLELDEIDVTRSAVCRIDSDCWDVKLIFFDPENVLGANAIRRAFRFTVDVSDLIPVQIGEFREWAIR